ncbi:MAG: hypothetical protein M1839_003610 [Geoglossum umbratile]|nr:MAG: hypothetical protein M1839_003610 [Geoglossum umbratile]
MAYPLSTTANILATIGFTAGLSRLLYGFFSSVRDAPSEIRRLAAELEALSTTFAGIEALDRELPARNAFSRDFLGRLRNCMADFEELEKRVRKSEKRLGQNPVTKIWARVQWPYRELVMAQFTKRVQSYHVTFSLALMTLQIRLGTNHQVSLESTQEALSTFKTVLNRNSANGVNNSIASPQKSLPWGGPQGPRALSTVEQPNFSCQSREMLGRAVTEEIAGYPACNLEHATPGPVVPLPVAAVSGSYAEPLSVRVAKLCHHEIWFIRLTLWRGPVFAQHWHRDRKPTFGPLSRDRSCGVGVSFACPYSSFGRVAFTASFMRKFNQPWISPSVHWNISLPTVVPNESEIVELASLGNVEAMVMLFRSGRASPTDVTPQGNTLLHIAVRRNHLQACKQLLLEGANVNAAGQDGDTPLHVAISRAQSYDIARLLIQNGADPGNCNSGLGTALHTFYNDAVHQTLLYHGEIIENDLIDGRGMTLLHFVTWSSKSTVEAVRRLVERGESADTILRDHEGRSALHFASQRGNTAVVEYLTGLGAHVDVRCRDRHGRTVLHYAVESRRVETISKLAARGADVRAKDDRGTTVLHHAAWRGNLEAAALLIELGAGEDVWCRDRGGMTPADLAAGQGKIEVARFLSGFAGRISGNTGWQGDERLGASYPGGQVCSSALPTPPHLVALQVRSRSRGLRDNEYHTSGCSACEGKRRFSRGDSSGSVWPRPSITRGSLMAAMSKTVAAAGNSGWTVLAIVLMLILYLCFFN